LIELDKGQSDFVTTVINQHVTSARYRFPLFWEREFPYGDLMLYLSLYMKACNSFYCISNLVDLHENLSDKNTFIWLFFQ